MEKQDVDVRCGERFKNARGIKKWSQTEMAERLTKQLKQPGVRIYGSTIAKIEAGTRPIKLAELVAAAELFDISVDALLRRDVKPKKDQTHALLVVADTAVKSSDHVLDVASAIRETIDDLVAYEGLPGRDILITGCERAYDLLTEANSAITDVAQAARKGVSRLLKAAR